MAKRLHPSNPFHKKVDELHEFMQKLGISIEYGGNGGLFIRDTESDNVYRLRDNDSGEQQPDFPTFAEFKLTQED